MSRIQGSILYGVSHQPVTTTKLFADKGSLTHKFLITVLSAMKGAQKTSVDKIAKKVTLRQPS